MNYPLRQLLLASACALLLTNRASATWYSANSEPGSDILMVEVRWPYWCVGTYFALWNSSPYPQGGYFYGGIAVYGKGEHATPAETEATLRHEVWSFWPSAAYKGERTWIEAVGNPFNGGSMSGEGTEAGIHSGILPFLEPQQWYRQVLRTWPDPHTPETRGYIGWWMEEVASGKWRLVGVVSFPVKVTGLSGNSSFVEATGSSGPGAIDPRIIDRRRAYYRSEGKWHKSDQISQKQEYSTAWQIIDNGSAFRFDCTATATNLPVSFRTNGNNVFVLTNQAAEPELGALKLEACRAIGLGSQLVVDWQVSDRNVPQLSYQLEAYSKPDGGGDLLATVKEALPQVNVKRLDLPGPAASVKLTLRDIFDRPIEKIIPVNPGTPQPAAQATALQPGLDYRYFEGDWKSVPAVEQLVPAKQGRVNTISDSATQGRTKSYAFSFTGYLKVPETGVYTFRLQTCDGSRLTIGPRVVADNDGVHTAITHLSHALLEKGLHPFRLDYFRGPEGIGTPTLLADWAGPNFNYRGIGPEDLVCERAANEPVAVLVPTLKDGNLLSIRQAHQLNGHSFSKLEVFAGKLMLGVIDQPDATPTYVLPAGKQVLWGRLWFNGGHSVDSGEQTIVSTDSRSPSWAYTVPGEQKLPLAVSTSENSVAVTGDGQFFAHREVTGDFTLTARVEDISRSTHENGIAGNSLVGLLASAHPDQLLGQDSFGLWDTAGLGIRGTANDRDLEASGLSRWTLDRDKPWLRITRQGRLWRGYTSTDGHAWTKVAERILAQQPSQYHVGVCFITRPPGQNKTLFSGKVGQITLVPEVAPDPTPAVALPAVRPGRFAGVICDPHSPDTFYVRTAGRGLMKSTDAGATLKPLTLTPLLRTLAVSPTTPAVLLAGTGDGKSGALWRSANGGATWAKTCESLDFDGAGADVLCGETISFSPFVAGQAAAAGASSGLYLSDDDGQTWRCAGLKEEHISVVAFSTKLKGLLIVGTSGTQTAPGRILFSADGGKQFHVFAEKRHWTVTNIAFESMVECENYIHFATSSGVYYCYNLGMYLYQYRHILAPDVPYTAITSWPISQQVGRNRILTAPANGSGTLYNGQIGYYWSVEWQPRNVAPGAAPEEINCLANAGKYGERVYATAANGLFLSRDQGKSFERLQP